LASNGRNQAVRFDKYRAHYSQAEVFVGSVMIADIPVVDVL
jgi:hypothetical protein